LGSYWTDKPYVLWTGTCLVFCFEINRMNSIAVYVCYVCFYNIT
jgi:hypothetical protein